VAHLGKSWAGRAFGTNTGNLAISFTKDEEELEGVVRFQDEQYGVVVYNVTGIFKDGVHLTGKTETVIENVVFGDLTVEATLTTEGSLKGEWSTTLGSGGPFIAHPHGGSKTLNASTSDVEIEQFYTRTHVLGALNLDRAAVLSLIELVKKDFNAGGRLIITYRNGGAEITKYGADFEASIEGLGELSYLKLFIQEPDEFGVNKMVIVELVQHGVSKIVVQGVRDIWVEGKARVLLDELDKRKRNLVTNFKKHGVSLTELAFFAMLVVIVDIQPFWSRAGFIAVFLVTIRLINWLHTSYIPNATIRMGTGEQSIASKYGVSIVSWLATILGALINSYLAYLLIPTG